ncbi:MAG: tyrosine--tRNA ligase [Oligoflexales bacterium]|nr:tyrosine--tRNA ligase [Oligoflexales bacterium]
MNFIQLMRQRDFIAQITHEHELEEHLAAQSRCAYVGFDPTASSLTAGHLVPIIALSRWQKAGNKAIALIGGGTALIGDPSGKSDMRQMLNTEKIYENGQSIKKQLERFLDLSDKKNGILLNNLDWLNELKYLQILRDIGPHFSVNRMLTADSVKLRLEKGLSFLEFNYSILQSYDFLELYRKHACSVQLGGDDQWSNMLGGMELVRRMENGKAFCVTVPLLLNSDGSKMGKTEKGAIWLDEEKTSPYEFYQYWRNIEDASVIKVLKRLSFLPNADILELSQLKGADINHAKKVLAFELCKIVHGEQKARHAEVTSEKLFSSGAADSGSEPVHEIEKSEFLKYQDNITEFVYLSKIFASKSEIRRLIQQGGLSIDDIKINSGDQKLPDELKSKQSWLLKKGKKSYYRINLRN